MDTLVKKKIKKEKKKVTVVVTIYNYKYSKQFESVLYSLAKQKIDKDIVLCEQSGRPSEDVIKLCEIIGIKYINLQPEMKDGIAYYNIGRVRNIAALCSNSEFLYFTDADILLTNENYLKTLVEYAEKNYCVPCMRPKMRRLKQEFHDAFSEDYLIGKMIQFDESNPYCYSVYDKQKAKIEPLKDGERYKTMYNLVHVGEPQYSMSDIEFRADRIEEFSKEWKTVVHFGGTLCRRKDFIEIGGYCEKYYNWGAEDIDFQWKLGESKGMQLIDYVITDYSVIHYEHKTRCNNDIYSRNRNVFTERREHDVKNIILDDITSKDSFIASWIRGDYQYCRNLLIKGKEYITEEDQL